MQLELPQLRPLPRLLPLLRHGRIQLLEHRGDLADRPFVSVSNLGKLSEFRSRLTRKVLLCKILFSMHAFRRLRHRLQGALRVMQVRVPAPSGRS